MEPTLTLDHPWRIKEDSFGFLCELAQRHQFRSLLEFGSGISTVRWAKMFPSMSIVAIDHDLKYFHETEDLLRREGVAGQVELQLRPLRWTVLKKRPFLTYSRPTLKQQFDLVIVDGPPGATLRGREACLYLAYDALKVGGYVVLDDLRRLSEQIMFANWNAVYGNSFDSSVHHVGNVIGLLKKTRHVERTRFSLVALEDTYENALQYLRFTALKRRKGSE